MASRFRTCCCRSVSSGWKVRSTWPSALAAFAASKPGRIRDPRDYEIEMLHGELARVTEAIKEQAIELSLVRGKSRWA